VNLFDIFFTAPQKEYLAAHPTWPTWLLWLGWNIRNPLPGLSRAWKGEVYSAIAQFLPCEDNGNQYVAYVDGHKCPTWNPKGGDLWVTLTRTRDGAKAKYRSHRGKLIEWSFGLKPSTGTLSITLRHANAKGY
jgi:hypothetical protein